ncbi:MAG TPA: choice-of-anchor Q domain-containing protein, partial [Anaerolineae bacterium]|nr:choice-of-anchor Q domain-containing protein [Anaerolineae bacterium]
GGIRQGVVTELEPLLGMNGGATATYALLPGSNGIDSAASCMTVEGELIGRDQRGYERPRGLSCDVGAFEACIDSVVVGVETTISNGMLALSWTAVDNTEYYEVWESIEDPYGLPLEGERQLVWSGTVTGYMTAGGMGDVADNRTYMVRVLTSCGAVWHMGLVGSFDYGVVAGN